MDQEKIGKFISTCRKEQNLTQAALAEKLGISDRAVSKWETGKSMPDSSIMMELCELLSINVNELLKGERIIMEEYRKVSEEITLEFKRQEEVQTKKLLAMEWVLMGLAFVSFLSLVGLGCYIEKQNNILGIAVIIFATIIMTVFALLGVWIEQQAGYYECADCGHRYRPTYAQALFAPHVGRARKMKCPHCKKKNYHKKVISSEQEK